MSAFALDLFDNAAAVEMPQPFVVVEIAAEPVGKRTHYRVLTSKKTKRSFAAAFTPAKTRSLQNGLTLAAKAAMSRAGHKAPTACALAMRVTATKTVPRSWSQKKREAALSGRIHPTQKPDDDNILKTRDALNGVVWVDDAQAVRSLVIKRYGESASLRIEVFEL